MIKHNGSEVSQIQFQFFCLTVYIICKAAFWNKSIGSKDMDSWRVAKTVRNKEIIFKEIIYFVWLYVMRSVKTCQMSQNAKLCF